MTNEVRRAVAAALVAAALTIGIVTFQSRQLHSLRQERRAQGQAAAKAFRHTYHTQFSHFERSKNR